MIKNNMFMLVVNLLLNNKKEFMNFYYQLFLSLIIYNIYMYMRVFSKILFIYICK